MTGMCGAMEALNDAGLSDVFTYNCGLSGSAWWAIWFFVYLLTRMSSRIRIIRNLHVWETFWGPLICTLHENKKQCNKQNTPYFIIRSKLGVIVLGGTTKKMERTRFHWFLGNRDFFRGGEVKWRYSEWKQFIWFIWKQFIYYEILPIQQFNVGLIIHH